MDPLLSVDQFAELTGKSISPLALQGASQIVRDFCGWPITAFADSVEQLDSEGTDTLFLPSLVVTDVSSLVASGVDRYGQPYPQPDATDWDWYGDGRLVWKGCWPLRWFPGPRRYTVTYSGGYTDVPASIQMVVLSLVERIDAPSAIHQKLSNVGGIQSNTTYAVSTDSNALTELEEAVLSPFTIRRVR
jgi:hypothetical protein